MKTSFTIFCFSQRAIGAAVRLVAVVLGLIGLANALGQETQFVFDLTGNLQAQGGEILRPPKIIGQPQMQIVGPGESASFLVVAANTRGLSYQWQFNGGDLNGATGDALSLTNVSAADEGVYSVVLANSSGSITSAPAALYIDADGDGLPDSWERAKFGDLSQNATGDFDGDGVSNLQEFLDGSDPTNAASAFYHLTVNNNGGSVLLVPDQPRYTNGQVVTLTAVAAGSPFHAWVGDVASRSHTITLTMDTNKTLFAYFGPVPFLWTNVAGGDWNTGFNWMPNLVPGTNDNVNIPITATVTLNSDADCADVTLGGFGSSPTLTGSGTLVVRGNLQWSSGTWSGSGRTVVETGGVFVIDVPVSGSVSSRTIELGGTTFWTGTGIVNLDGGIITNRPGALFDVQSSATFSSAGFGVPRVDNAGVFRMSAGDFMDFFFVPFNNYDQVEVLSGALILRGGGTNAGSISVGDGATFQVASGTFNSGTTSTILGGGHFLFSGGTANFDGNWLNTSQLLEFSGGTANFDGNGTIAPEIVNLNGAFGGAQTVTVKQALNWIGGTMSGSGRTVILPGATLNAAVSSFAALTTRTLEIGGTAVWTGLGSLSFGGVITNRPGALFEVQNALFMNFGGGSPRFDNAGVFRKSVNAGQCLIAGSFNNYNVIDLKTGTLSLIGGGVNDGAITVPAGTTLELGGVFSSSADSTIVGPGVFNVSGGTVTLAGLVNVTGSNVFSGGVANVVGGYFCTNNTLTIDRGTVNLDGTGIVAPPVLNLFGVLGGGQTVTVGGLMNWTGGTMSGTGRTVVLPGATLNAAFTTFATLTTRTLEIGGTAVWTGVANFGFGSGVITNRPGALFEVQNALSVNYGGGTPRFDNAGTFRKSISTGMLVFNPGLALNNYGTIDIRAGILGVFGGYASSSNALLNCALGGTSPGTNYGQLQVAGTVNLDGGLSVELLPGFTPALNDSFTVVTAGARNGVFNSFKYPSNRVSMSLSNTPNSVIVLATNIFAVPTPLLLPPHIVGSNFVLTWTATSNVTYRVEDNGDLSGSNWTALSPDVTTLSNTATKVDPLTPTNRVYRVRALP